MKLTLTDQQLRQQVRFFGYYQCVAGMLLLVLVLRTIIGRQPHAGLYLVCLAASSLAAFMVYCGYLTQQQPRRGLLLSRYHLVAQLLGVAVGGVAVELFAGLYVTVGLDFASEDFLRLNAGFSSFLVRLGSGDATRFSVNMVAMGLFLLTTKWLNEWNYRYPITAGQ